MNLSRWLAPRYNLHGETTGASESTRASAEALRTHYNTPSELDVDRSRVYIETSDGYTLLPGWYFAAKPRHRAVVVPLDRDGFCDDRPRSSIVVLAWNSVRRGVSVLIVDARRRGLRGWLFGPSRDEAMVSATDYLCERGYEVDAIECAVPHARSARGP